MFRLLIITFVFMVLTGCSSQYPNQDVSGQQFPIVSGENLEKKRITIPTDFNEQLSLLLIGYKQDSQFDIDRWLIGLDMTGVTIPTYELPTIQGMAPRMFSTLIDNGMRKGIPKELWGGVITIYKDGDAVQAFTGNENPNNTRVVLLDSDGTIIYFYDRGFSVSALNKLKAVINN
ncbi:hypothetical protein AMS58_02470 [Pseudoalteromonas porphyrae]|uniref:Lipoprotein n=1 Tax=Pseudoalteromonas porphyrae TaxID=187330 RepID=A0A0N1ELH3_9GAMM|nr:MULTISPECIES: hypothetical protein [Pseudoalteromonas]KPH63812.1 hypothetical protein ADS77_07815 [Pseudoalteromonas porphyrae]KPH96440.1 hypothetical protein AMS58_02470 [Pseudoalteromonas porphyrae]NMR25760.1 hypothetical protein [Pseudoalteromonas sp. NEC-BIFX-2020_015]NNG41835.1 hypothetical protein [Pseudoalteromonas sp. NEC-BIFX-2020_002]